MDFMVFLKISGWKMPTNEEKHTQKRSGRDVFVAQAICLGIPLGMALLLCQNYLMSNQHGTTHVSCSTLLSAKKKQRLPKERKLGRCCAVGTFQGNILIFRFPCTVFSIQIGRQNGNRFHREVLGGTSTGCVWGDDFGTTQNSILSKKLEHGSDMGGWRSIESIEGPWKFFLNEGSFVSGIAEL